MVRQTESCIDLIEKTDRFLDDVFNLVRHHEDVGIILGKAADTEQTMKGTGQFMTVNKTQFTDTQRQVTVGMGLTVIDQHATGAVHRFDGIIFAVNLREVHIFLIVIPVTARFPKLAVHDHRRGNFIIVILAMNFTPVIDEFVAKDHAVWQEERKARAVVAQHEETKLFAQFPVVTLFCFFQHMEIGFQVFLAGKSRAIDALEHLVFSSPRQ